MSATVYGKGLKPVLVDEITIHPAAEAEYEEALGWYLDRSIEAAERFEAAFAEAIEAILTSPIMFPKCDEFHQYVLLQGFPYSLIYRVDDAATRIMAVAHSKRRTRYWSERS